MVKTQRDDGDRRLRDGWKWCATVGGMISGRRDSIQWLNASGKHPVGTKPMALAAYEVSGERDVRFPMAADE